VSRCCEKLADKAQGKFGKPDEGGRSPLETASKKRLGKTSEDNIRLRRLKCVLK
jgi:hypothetical protein